VKITDIKSSPSKVKYFNAILHDGKTETPLVSYNTAVNETLLAANLKEQPVKVSNFPMKLDAFKNESVITMGNQSKVEYSTRTFTIPFAMVKDKLKSINTFASLKDIIESIAPEELVNIGESCNAKSLHTPTSKHLYLKACFKKMAPTWF